MGWVPRIPVRQVGSRSMERTLQCGDHDLSAPQTAAGRQGRVPDPMIEDAWQDPARALDWTPTAVTVG